MAQCGRIPQMQRDARAFARPRLNAVPNSARIMGLEFPRGNPDGRSSPEQFPGSDWRIEIMNKIKVVQIIPLLSPGGAERVAVHLATGLNRRRYETTVISLSGRVGCDLDHMLEEAEIEARYLGKHPGFDYRVYTGWIAF